MARSIAKVSSVRPNTAKRQALQWQQVVSRFLQLWLQGITLLNGTGVHIGTTFEERFLTAHVLTSRLYQLGPVEPVPACLGQQAHRTRLTCLLVRTICSNLRIRCQVRHQALLLHHRRPCPRQRQSQRTLALGHGKIVTNRAGQARYAALQGTIAHTMDLMPHASLPKLARGRDRIHIVQGRTFSAALGCRLVSAIGQDTVVGITCARLLATHSGPHRS